MEARRNGPSPGDLVSEIGAMMTGLGVLSFMWIPFAIPALLLALVMALPLVVLALPLLVVWLLLKGASRLLGLARREEIAERPGLPQIEVTQRSRRVA